MSLFYLLRYGVCLQKELHWSGWSLLHGGQLGRGIRDNVFVFLREAKPVGLVVVGVGFPLLDVLKVGLGIYGSGDWEVG